MSDNFNINGTDYIELIVGNAKQATHFYQTQFGFEPDAYRGLETGEREKVSYVLRQNKITLVLTSSLTVASDLNEHIRLHGDGVKDVAFWVDDTREAWEFSTKRGAISAYEPETVEDENGSLVKAGIRTYGDTIHSFIECKDYKGIFLPGFEKYVSNIPVKPVGLNFVDHFVGNQPEAQMQKIAQWYEEKLGFHRFWTADDKDISTEYTSLRSIVVANDNERIKMPINRPAAGLRKYQIQEFVEYYSVAGDFMSRKGVSEESITLHPRGLPHGPQPGKYESSIGKKETDEVAVMLDTFSPLQITEEAMQLDDPQYPYSWLEDK